MTIEPSKRLLRSTDNRMIAGVCGGLGAYFGIDPTVVRLVFAILGLGGAGVGLPLYILLWIVMPKAKPTLSVDATAEVDREGAAGSAPPAFTEQEIKAWDLQPAGVEPATRIEAQ